MPHSKQMSLSACQKYDASLPQAQPQSCVVQSFTRGLQGASNTSDAPRADCCCKGCSALHNLTKFSSQYCPSLSSSSSAPDLCTLHAAICTRHFAQGLQVDEGAQLPAQYSACAPLPSIAIHFQALMT